MWIRYIARTDDTPLGNTAAWYCDALVMTGMPVRLVPTRVAEFQVDARGRFASTWDYHRGLLLTPMDGLFVNVVCGEVSDWARYYTDGVTNALLLSMVNCIDYTKPETEALLKYDVVYAPSHFVAAHAKKMADVTPILVKICDASAFRNLKVF